MIYEGINVLLFGEEELPFSFGAFLHKVQSPGTGDIFWTAVG